MRSKHKEPKHGSNNKKSVSIKTEIIAESLKNTGEKINNNLNNIKNNAENLGKDLVKKSDGLNKGYVFLGIGVAFFLVTSILSINFAVNSKINTAINTAYEALDTNLIYNGIFIEEVNISGLTKEQAIRRGISDYAGPRLSRTITITYGSYSKDLTYEDLGGSYDIESTVNEAYKLGRSGSKAKRLETTDNLENRREYLVSSLSIDKGKMKSTLKEIAKEVEPLNHSNSKMDIDSMADAIEHDMLIGQEDIEFNISFKSW